MSVICECMYKTIAVVLFKYFYDIIIGVVFIIMLVLSALLFLFRIVCVQRFQLCCLFFLVLTCL